MTGIQRRSSFQVRDLRDRSLSPYRLPRRARLHSGPSQKPYPAVKGKVDPCFSLGVSGSPERAPIRLGRPNSPFPENRRPSPRAPPDPSQTIVCDRPPDIATHSRDSNRPHPLFSPAIERETPDAPQRIWGMMEQIPSGSTPAGGW